MNKNIAGNELETYMYSSTVFTLNFEIASTHRIREFVIFN